MISFVYFDLGGVVVCDFSGTNKWEELKNEIGISSEKSKEFDLWFDEIEPSLNRGKNLDGIQSEMEDKFGAKFPSGYSFLKNGFIDRFEKNESIWPLINKVQKKYRTGLLTNMYPRMFESLLENEILPPVSWEIIIDSSKVGFQKPDKEIFEIAEERTGVNPKEIFFTDNTKSHIVEAEKLGWQTYLYDSSNVETSNKELRKLLLDF